jgi:hypothetical protein
MRKVEKQISINHSMMHDNKHISGLNELINCCS